MNQQTDIDIPQAEKPTDRFQTVVNGEPKEVFMSAGLIRELVPIASAAGEIGQIYTNIDVQEALLIVALKPRQKRGDTTPKIEEGKLNLNYSMDDFEMTVDDGDKFLTWIVEHVLYFFVNSLSLTKNLVEKNKTLITKLAALMEFLTGSPDSQAQKLSVGPSDQSQAT